jgi:oxygen-independent coproporphyrinogen-3 oxidase
VGIRTHSRFHHSFATPDTREKQPDGSHVIINLSKMNLAGIYIHIPFCRARCSYCDFATGTYNGALAERYVRALSKEIRSFPTLEHEAAEADTIYFGGGTPSLLSPAQVKVILEAVHERFPVSANAEVTMEMNPGTLTPQTLLEFKRLGINRASFGAQTFDDRELSQLGRTHTAQDVRLTIKYLREAGFTNVSFDLIAGLPGQTLEAWAKNLREALSLRPEHLSFYLLEVHEGTPLAEQIKRGRMPLPDDDLAAEMYRLMLTEAGAAGYEHYEISNLTLPGFESRHNSKYWLGHPTYGFGCSSHSFDGERRRWSHERDALGYTELIETGRTPVVENFELSETDVEAEAVFLGLRLLRGINLREYRARFGRDLYKERAEDLKRLSEAGLIELTDELLRLTPTGALLSNEVFATFV